MKHGCELVIFGFVAMQCCSYFQIQNSGNHGEIQSYMVNIQFRKRINEYTAHENRTKQYAAFIEFPSADLVKFIL